MIRKIIFIGVFLLSMVASNGANDPTTMGMTTPSGPTDTDPSAAVCNSLEESLKICKNACNQCKPGQCNVPTEDFCLGYCNCNPFFVDPCKKCDGLSGTDGPSKCTEFCSEKCNCNVFGD